MVKQSVVSAKYGTILLGGLVLFGLYLTSLYNYLLFHSLAEIFSIVIAFSIFVLAWNSRRFLSNGYLLFLGMAYLFIAGLDLIHTLAYKGMGVFPGYDANLPTQLWIATRYLESLSLIVALLFLRRKFNPYFVFIGYTVVISILLGTVFYWHVFPDCFIEGSGLTPFKKISEYIISLLLAASIALLFQKREDFDAGVFHLLIVSIVFTIGSELAFTFYISVYGFSNLVGHFFKIISFYFIYKALIEVGLTQPYNLLFRNLRQSEAALKAYSERLEEMVEERTWELRETQEQLVRQEKLAVLGQLAGGVAHELRNPLGIIKNAVYFLNMVMDASDPETEETFTILARQIRKANQIIDGLLDFARTKNPVRSEVDVNGLVREALSGNPAPDDAQIEIISHLDESLPTIQADPDQLERVFDNLILNALQAMPEGGQLVVRSEALRPSWMAVSVTDSGVGIPEENLEKLFEPLFTTKATGIGLGLALVKNLVEVNGGSIEVESNGAPGNGSTFTVRLPIRGAEARGE
jgi:signal transduction histidine kinase